MRGWGIRSTARKQIRAKIGYQWVCPWCLGNLPRPAADYEFCPECKGSFSWRKPVEKGGTE